MRSKLPPLTHSPFKLTSPPRPYGFNNAEARPSPTPGPIKLIKRVTGRRDLVPDPMRHSRPRKPAAATRRLSRALRGCSRATSCVLQRREICTADTVELALAELCGWSVGAKPVAGLDFPIRSAPCRGEVAREPPNKKKKKYCIVYCIIYCVILYYIIYNRPAPPPPRHSTPQSSHSTPLHSTPLHRPATPLSRSPSRIRQTQLIFKRKTKTPTPVS